MDKQTALVDSLKILWTARMHAAGDHWHVEERCVPMLVELADQTGEPLVRRAIQRTNKAYEFLDLARASMGEAIKLLEEYSAPDDAESGEDVGGEVAGCSVVRSDLNGRDLAVEGQPGVQQLPELGSRVDPGEQRPRGGQARASNPLGEPDVQEGNAVAGEQATGTSG